MAYNPPVSVLAYPNPRVVITGTTPVDEILNNPGGNIMTPGRGENTLAYVLALEHPVYREYKSQWMDWYNWYTGDHIEDYIYQHVRERVEAFQRRKKRAYYFNYVSSILDLIGSFLFSRAITRSFSTKARGVTEDSPEDDADTEFLKNPDLKGTSLNDFMRMVFNYTKIFGYVDVMVDMPYTPIEILTEQERIELGMRPYIYPVLPTQMHNWEVDKEGNFLWIRWHEPVNRQDDPFGLPISTNTVRYITWTRDDWYIHEVTYQWGQAIYTAVVDQQQHNLGVVPCVRFYGKKDLLCNTLGKSMVGVMGKINVAIANYVSLIEEEIFAKTLNILAFEDPSEGEDDTESGSGGTKRGLEIGNNNVVLYGKGTNPPQYIAPQSAPGEFIMAFIEHCVTEIYRVATLGSDTGVDQTKSGAAYSYEFNETNRMLADNADLMQEGEEKIHALRALWLGKPYEGYVDYPDSFDIGSYSDELQATVDAKAAIRSPTFGQELEKRFARRMLERSSAAVADKIMQEIDSLPEKTTIYATQRGATVIPESGDGGVQPTGPSPSVTRSAQ